MSEAGRSVVVVFRLQLFKPSETFVTAQAQALRRFTPLYLGRRRFGLAPEGAEVREPDRSLLTALRLLLADPGPWIAALGDKVGKVALVHAHFGADALYAAPLARALGVPLVVTLHGYDVSRSRMSLLLSGRPALVRLALGWRALARRADRLVAVSGEVAQAALHRGAPAGRLVTLPIGVDLSRLRAPTGFESGLIVHVGRLVEKKGGDTLLQAFAVLAARRPQARLVVIGDGPLRRRLQRAAGRLNLQGRVRFLGAQPHATALDWLARAEGIAVPSRTARNGDAEGLPTVLLEAAALERAVVASDIAPIACALRDEESALLTPPGDAPALARSLARLLEEPGLAQRLGAAARTRVEADFDLRRRTAELEALYAATLDEHGR